MEEREGGCLVAAQEVERDRQLLPCPNQCMCVHTNHVFQEAIYVREMSLPTPKLALIPALIGNQGLPASCASVASLCGDHFLTFSRDRVQLYHNTTVSRYSWSQGACQWALLLAPV